MSRSMQVASSIPNVCTLHIFVSMCPFNILHIKLRIACLLKVTEMTSVIYMYIQNSYIYPKESDQALELKSHPPHSQHSC